MKIWRSLGGLSVGRGKEKDEGKGVEIKMHKLVSIK